MDGYETTDAIAPAETVDQAAPEVTEGAPEGTSAAPAETESFSTALEDLPEGDALTQEFLQERYRQMQADYTRKTQEIADFRSRGEELEFLDALRSDPDVQRALHAQLTELLGEDAADEVMDDTLNADEDQPENGSLEHQVAELRAAEEERQAVALASQIVDHLDQLQKDAGVELEQHDLAQIFDAATAQGVGRQQTEAAFKAHVDRLKAIEERAVARYLESKKGSQQVPTGTPAQATPDLKDPEARQRRFAAILEGSN